MDPPTTTTRLLPDQQQNPNFDSNVISERVKNLATQIYQELKRIISRLNYDEEILSGLMPLIVRVLESLDLALIENQQLQVELELCKDDNDQITIMFEKEKAAKRAIDKKLIESEYAYEEERQQFQQKIDSLDSVVKMLELKAKNASDQAIRFEEKEAERKKEYNKLHDRYTELLKSHCDVVERARHLIGNSEAGAASNTNVPQQMVGNIPDLISASDQFYHSHQASKLKHDLDPEHKLKLSTTTIAQQDTQTSLKSWNADADPSALEDASLVVIDDMIGASSGSQKASQSQASTSSHNESLDRLATEGEQEKEGENDSIAYTSMEKEFRKLIQDNKDLLNTKNALNVVKDDLIAEVDRLTNEISMYEQSVEQLNSTKDQMKQRLSTLDAELRKTKEELEKARQKIRENNEEGVPYSNRKRFGRAEMAKVLMERNEYKEKYIELQDAVRYTEIVRANSKVETEKRSGLWKFFSNLFGAQPPGGLLAIGPGTSGNGSGALASGQTMSRNSSPIISGHQSSSPGDRLAGGPSGGADLLQSGAAICNRSILSTNQRLASNSDMIVLMDSELNSDRSRVMKDGSSAFMNTDQSGYIHAYGWSLSVASLKVLASSRSAPGSSLSPRNSTLLGDTPTSGASPSEPSAACIYSLLSGLQVPIPQYCRPLTGDSPGMKLWCAAAIDLTGGDCGYAAGQKSDFSRDEPNESASSSSLVNITSTPVKSANQSSSAIRQLEREVDEALKGAGSNPSSSQQDGPSALGGGGGGTTSERVRSFLTSPLQQDQLSSFVWICSTKHSRSKITIIDIKTKPNELLDSFHVSTFLYCVKSVPGAKTTDLQGIVAANVEDTPSDQQTGSLSSSTLNLLLQLIDTQRGQYYKLAEVDLEAERKTREDRERNRRCSDVTQLSADTTPVRGQKQENEEHISRILDNNQSSGVATLEKLNDYVAHTQELDAKTSGDLDQQDEPSVVLISQETSAGAGIGPPTTASARVDTEKEPTEPLYYQPISTHLSTVWMGGRNSVLYVHSAIGQWKECIASVKLSDSILQILHFRGRVFVALADGTLCVFFRNIGSKEWEFSRYLVIDINLMASTTSDIGLGGERSSQSVDDKADLAKTAETETELATSQLDSGDLTNLSEQLKNAAIKEDQKLRQERDLLKSQAEKNKPKSKVAGIRCLEIANGHLWVGYRNMIVILDPVSLKLKHTASVVPQLDNQIRQLVSLKDGVFCCLRSDLILRLYSALKPYQHIQNIDVEPVVMRLISPKSFVISHITAMKVADNTLWIGNAHGIILTIPYKLVPQVSEAPTRDQGGSSSLGDLEGRNSSSSLSIARFVPKCDIANSQISFHGHKDAVKFLIQIENLMLSGGQGYLDFRLDMDDQSKSINDKSHLILWQLPDHMSQ